MKFNVPLLSLVLNLKYSPLSSRLTLVLLFWIYQKIFDSSQSIYLTVANITFKLHFRHDANLIIFFPYATVYLSHTSHSFSVPILNAMVKTNLNKAFSVCYGMRTSPVLIIFQLLSLPRSHLFSPRTNCTNFKNGLLMTPPHWFPGADHLNFGHCYIPYTVPLWQRKLSSLSSSPSQNEGGWGIPIGNHELRDFWMTHSVSPSLGWKLEVVVTVTVHFTIYAFI